MKKQNSGLKVKGIADALQNKLQRLKVTYIIKNDGDFYGDDLIPAQQFEDSLPIEFTLNRNKGKGLDGRTNFY